jgi:molecular chaperone IbpA
MTKTLTLRSFDIPQIHKFGIGFEPIFEELMRVSGAQTQTNYPPHNVIKTGENTVTIEVAVAGFAEGEIDIQVDKRTLTISGEQIREESADWEYLHRGISSRNFTQNFSLADHVEVKSASIRNGILRVYLERTIPEADKPKSIAINYQN